MSLKLLDYGNPKPFGQTVGGPRNLAWPVNAYRVTLPEISGDHDNLNPFERVILKMIDTGGEWDAEKLAEEACIPADLIRCVLLRLQDKGFLDEYNKISDAKRNDWEREERAPQHFVAALLFRELVTGKILPFLHLLDDNNPLKKKEGEERFFRKIHSGNCDKNSSPEPRDIICALRAMKKRSIAFDNEIYLPNIQQITIAKEPELYYVDCPIAIQKSDGEFRIADPFGNGFSLILENAFNSLLEQDSKLKNWFMKWKESLSNPRQEKSIATPKEPYDNDENRGCYPKLVVILRIRRNALYRSISQIYAALEWALFYACAQRPYNNAVKQLEFKNQSEHPDLLKKAAKGIKLESLKGGFLPVLEGRLKSFLSGKAEMGTVLSIALLIAENDASHPLRHIAAKHPDFIIRIFDIKKKRDEQGHGKGNAQKNEIELPDDSFMREIVSILLPSIRFSDTPNVKIDQDAAADLLLDARTSIQGEFGFGLFNRLGSDLQNRLIYAERFWLSCKDGDDALTFAWDLYAATQAIFTKFQGELSFDPEILEFTKKAAENAVSAGLGDLPDALRTVKVTCIQKTLQGENQTLGACAVAFLLGSDVDTLRSVTDAQLSFLSDVADIISRREHGNEPLPLPKREIGKLRKSTYQTMKTLLET